MHLHLMHGTPCLLSSYTNGQGEIGPGKTILIKEMHGKLLNPETKITTTKGLDGKMGILDQMEKLELDIIPKLLPLSMMAQCQVYLGTVMVAVQEPGLQVMSLPALVPTIITLNFSIKINMEKS